jgi:hypothetical protein
MSPQLTEDDKKAFITQIDDALHAGWITSQQADGSKSLFDVGHWDMVVCSLLKKHLVNARDQNEDTKFLKDVILSDLKSEYRSKKRPVRNIKSIWRKLWIKVRVREREVYNWQHHEESDDSFAEHSDWEGS